jgi:hypothetical protein
MKKIIIISLLLSSVLNSFSQDFTYKIAEKTCDYISTISDTLSSEKFNMELGLYLIKESMPYKAQFKKEYNIDLNNLSKNEGLKLGKLIGAKLVVICPKAITRMTNKANDEKIRVEENLKIITGIVTSIESDNFVIFSLKDDFGRVFKFYWMSFIKSAIDLPANFHSLVGKKLNITYEKKDYFDPKILDYRTFNIILKLDSEIN